MPRRVRHDEHVNHEAWAIPYGDLITLLLAFFVVMYAISSVNEGKYRVAADAITTAFGAPPKSLDPVSFGRQVTGANYDEPAPIDFGQLPGIGIEAGGSPASMGDGLAARVQGGLPIDPAEAAALREAMVQSGQQLDAIQSQVERALGSLILQDQVTVKREGLWIEVNIRSDVLYASGSATPGTAAIETLNQLGEVLRELPNDVRVEGHTDDVPIRSAIYPSNWELSAARAASVVTLLEARGVDSRRLSVVGYADKRPLQTNATPAGRGANRRVMLIILATPQAPVDPSGLVGAVATPPGPVLQAVDAATGLPVGEVPASPVAVDSTRLDQEITRSAVDDGTDGIEEDAR